MSTNTARRRALRPSGKLLQEDARRHHRALILQELFAEGPRSRADLARSSGLTRVTVSDLVAELIEDDLVAELGAPVESRVGKPPILVGLRGDALQIVVLDLSVDDQVTGAVLTLAGEVCSRDEQPLGGAKGDAALALVHTLTRRLLDRADHRVLGVGVGSPGIVDPAGTVVDAPNLGWHQVPLAAGLHEAFGLPVYVANDANTAVLGEHTYGQAGEGGLMLLRVGTGVGAGLVLEGALLHGHRNAAGEIGHVVVDPEGQPCACGRVGCLETIVAVPHLRPRLAQAADPDAVRTAVGEQLGRVLSPVVGALNLHELVLSGPAELLDGALLAATDRVIREYTMPVSGEQLVVRTSTLGDDVVLLGAAVLVLAGELGVS
ncbi:ROK family transcriptional regulator [Nocardioides sp. BP30]|uniref:ROK family protein n=1 Tax=Nocardioides sp. BP30 TaxID=3036374 RepID=UPI002468D73D|nr:ROK family transcriptional regulator [Nocardioides sp. BP30]WGL51045.1 ROK family transcriptional regulator [Nocardioides sp. BP30]